MEEAKLRFVAVLTDFGFKIRKDGRYYLESPLVKAIVENVNFKYKTTFITLVPQSKEIYHFNCGSYKILAKNLRLIVKTIAGKLPIATLLKSIPYQLR